MIEVKGISKRFGTTQVLTDINAVFQKGKVNQIIGKSGSGKSVLANASWAYMYPKRDRCSTKAIRSTTWTAMRRR